MIPGVVYSEKFLKGQYVILAKNTTNKWIEVSFSYNVSQLKNCRLGLKKQGNKIVYKLRPKDGSNMGTIDTIALDNEEFEFG